MGWGEVAHSFPSTSSGTINFSRSHSLTLSLSHVLTLSRSHSLTFSRLRLLITKRHRLLRLQVLVEEVRHFDVQVPACIIAIDTVIAVWIIVRIVLFIGFDQRSGHLCRILKMHIVIGVAMHEQIIAGQAIYEIDWTIVLIPF